MRVDLRRLAQRFISRGLLAARGKRPAKVRGGVDPLPRLPETHGEAAQRLYDPAALADRRFLARSDAVRRDGLHPDIDDFLVAFLRELHRRGFPFYLHSGLRTDSEQLALFNRGVTKARPGQSPHNHGMAVDVVHFRRGWDLTAKEWAIVGLIGKEVARKRNLKIRWGGDWAFYDPAHWELLGWSDLARGGVVRGGT